MGVSFLYCRRTYRRHPDHFNANIFAALCTLLMVSYCHCGEPDSQKVPEPKRSSDIYNLSLKELMDLKITSVSKRVEKAVEAPAALYVITQEDIRRSGVTSIAEALRMAPGLDVARITASQWAISSRGFNDFAANKLLVLMDGRSVYTPLFSGTLWDVQDTMLEDIDRIEVIRGPGATQWGSNAVNGVINIITKSAKDTQGGLVSAGAGTEERGFGNARYGGKIGSNVYIRGYVKYFDRDDQALPHDRDASDDWRAGRGGFRLDWDATKQDLFTFQGDIYRGRAGDTVAVPDSAAPFSRLVTGDDRFSGGNLLGRWSHHITDTSELKVQMYYDRTDYEKVATTEEHRNTYDLDTQYQFQWGSMQKIICGAGYRVSSDHTRPGITGSFDPQDRTTRLASAFIADEISVIDKKLSLTLGSKFEYNDFTGFEVQPNIRLLWLAEKNHTVWASISRAVRIPNRTDDDVRFNIGALPPGALGPGTPSALTTVIGDKDAKSEELLAYELGYRAQLHPKFSVDLTGFLNMYDNLMTVEPRTPVLETSPAPPHLDVPLHVDNQMKGETYGGEATANFQAFKRWRLQANYSYLRMQLHLKDGSHSESTEQAEGRSPRNQAMLRSLLDLPHQVQLDFDIRYVDALPNLHVPHYVVGDARVGWRPTEKLDVSLVGQNLFDNHHPEFKVQGIKSVQTEVQNSVYLKATLKF